jgi:hypothetical protein
LQQFGFGDDVLEAERPQSIAVVRTLMNLGHIGSTETRSAMTQQRLKILFLAANPMATSRLDLEEELRTLGARSSSSQSTPFVQMISCASSGANSRMSFISAGMDQRMVLSCETMPATSLSRDNLGDVYRVFGKTDHPLIQ